MNYCVPDWSMEDDLRPFHDLLPSSNQKKSVEEDNELVELLWRNGHVVMQSQNSRKHPPNTSEFRPPQKPDLQVKPDDHLANPSSLIQEDETASWFQYALDDSLGKEFCSEFLSEPLMTNVVDNNKPNKEIVDGAKDITMPPPKAHNAAVQLASGLAGGPVNFSHFARPMKNDARLLKPGSRMVLGVGESSSLRTVGASACGSNQIQNQAEFSQTRGVMGKGMKDSDPMILLNEGPRTNTLDAAVTSSSGGSGCSFGRMTGPQSTSNQNEKRKGRDVEESECRSEEAEYESVEANRPVKRPASARKSRAAEVHNLSERRRRDRINEKMKALQELIPHCNKSDKASMLDEAIEYLKSLQLQLQLMWMGSRMAPMMFPGVQQYMPRVGSGMVHPYMTSINNPIQLSRAPLVNHSMPSTSPTNQIPMCPPPAINPINFTTPMQNVHVPEPYARYFGLPQMQPPPQAMNLYAYGPHMVQQNQAAAGSSSLPTAGIPSEDVQNGQSADNRLMQDNHHRQSSLNPSDQ